MSEKLPSAIFGVGAACVAAYLESSGISSWLLWIIVAFCAVNILDL